MREGPDISLIGNLIGDAARANMLTALMSGLALSAGELAREAGITPQTASAHLARLIESGLVVIEVQGRHRYARLAGPEVAAVLENLMELAARTGRLRTRPGPRDAAMRHARVCYDHLAGEMGVRMYDALALRGWFAAGGEGVSLSAEGRAGLVAEGVDVAALARKSRPLCRLCLDWSERRPHLAGAVGAALLQTVLQRGWAKRDEGGRTLRFDAAGEAALVDWLTTAGRVSPKTPRQCRNGHADGRRC